MVLRENPIEMYNLVFLVKEMIKDHLQRVPERIQFVGSKLLQNQNSHLTEKHHLEKSLFYFEKMSFPKQLKISDNYALCKKVKSSYEDLIVIKNFRIWL